MMTGYWNKPEATAETMKNGWLHTGDVGRMDEEGFFYITDRMKDIIITAGGKNITPSEFENELKFSSYISDAVVIGAHVEGMERRAKNAAPTSKRSATRFISPTRSPGCACCATCTTASS